MKLTDAELKQVMTRRWHKCQETNRLYWRAQKIPLAEALKPLEPLLAANDKAIAAYKEVQAEFMKRTKRV